MTQTVPPRSAVPVEHTWDSTSVFASDALWEAELAQIAADLPALAQFRGRLAQGPQVLAEWLERSFQMYSRVSRATWYANMFHTVDTADQDASAKYDRALGLQAQVLAELAFGAPEIIAIGFETLERWLVEEPDLAIYAQYIDTLRRRQPHVLLPELEQLLGGLSGPFRSATAIHGVLSDADLRFEPARSSAGEPVELVQGSYGALMSSPDRELRRTAWEHYADAYLSVKNTLAACIATGVKQRVFLARTRRYDSALEAALAENFIPVTVFHQLIDTYRRHLPIWHRYWRVRRQALGYDQLHVYDVRAPLSTRPHVPFDQAVEWICAGLQPLGNDYVQVMRRGLTEQRWVDIYPNQGKYAGAFSYGTQGTHPFILMSYVDDVFSVSTLAHELGHSMHSYYSRKTQPYVYSSYTIFAAEVASNFNQAMVRSYLLANHTDPDFQIALIEEAMFNFHRYFFLMPALARLELTIHQRVERGESLTATDLNELMLGLFREGYGDEVVIDPERVGCTWAQFPTHLYANFYVYQYATGIAAAHTLAERILAGESGAVDRYLTFLKSGSSGYTLDLLKQAGVDMTTPEPVEQAFGVLARMVERLEVLCAERRA